MSYVLRVIGAAGEAGPSPYAGQFVRGFDPTAGGGRGSLDLTRDRSQALKFSEKEEALTYWSQSNGTRPDGQPNRPLSAFTMSIEPAESGGIDVMDALFQPGARLGPHTN